MSTVEETIEAYRDEAGLYHGIAETWGFTVNAVDRALAEARTAVQNLSQKRAALQKTNPVTRLQLAEEQLLEQHAKNLQPALTALGQQLNKAQKQRDQYRKLAQAREDAAQGLERTPEPLQPRMPLTPAERDVMVRNAQHAIKTFLDDFGIDEKEVPRSTVTRWGYTREIPTGDPDSPVSTIETPWPANFTDPHYKRLHELLAALDDARSRP